MCTAWAMKKGIFKLRLYSEIEINASGEQVWEVLTDIGSYHKWNPVFLSATGEAKVGSNLKVIIRWPGLKAGSYKLKVLIANPNRELRWLGHFVFPGLLDGNHVFYIKPQGEGSVHLIQLEDFAGLIVPFFQPWLKHNVLRGFEKLNEALKNRSEGLQTRQKENALRRSF